MAKKYIVINNGGLAENVILFDEVIEHSRVGHGFHVVSAGFWDHCPTKGNYWAYGKSTSLDIESRPEEDSKLIKKFFEQRYY